MNTTVAVALLFAALSPLPAEVPKAATGGAVELRPAGINSGGGYSAGGAFELEGSLSQPEATNRLSGGAFTLTGGIRLERGEGVPPPSQIFRNGFE
jgi:hypothetical protein